MESVSLFNLFFGKESIKGLLLPVLGLLFGMALLPLVFQVNNDVQKILKGGETNYQYLQISKEVGISTTLGFGTINFNDSEIKQLKAQSFIDDVAKVISNNFRVYVEAPKSRGGGGFDGYMHAVPTDFLDEQPSSFTWKEGQNEIPVIISNQFFTLLNTGVLSAQGQPPIPKIAIKQLSLPVYLGRGQSRLKMRVRVVGFSDRITTVVVPGSFVKWANNRFHPGEESKSTLAILKVKDSGNVALAKYLKDNDYEVNKEQLVAQKGLFIAQVILMILFVLGIVISFLSINSVILFVRLVILNSLKKIEMLIVLGYTSSSISSTIIKFFSFLVVVVGVVSFLIDTFLINSLHDEISTYSSLELNYSSLFIAFIPFAVALIVVFMNISINRVIKQLSISK